MIYRAEPGSLCAAIRANFFWRANLSLQRRQRRSGLRFLFQTVMLCTYSIVWQSEIGIRPKDKMVEIFNLRLKSRNKAERQEWAANQASLWGERYGLYDPVSGLQRPGQSFSSFISSWRWCSMPLCAFYSPWRIYDDCDRCFSFLTPFREEILILLVVQPTERVCVANSAACSTLQQIVCVSGYGSKGQTECTMSVCVCGRVFHDIWGPL